MLLPAATTSQLLTPSSSCHRPVAVVHTSTRGPQPSSCSTHRRHKQLPRARCTHSSSSRCGSKQQGCSCCTRHEQRQGVRRAGQQGVGAAAHLFHQGAADGHRRQRQQILQVSNSSSSSRCFRYWLARHGCFVRVPGRAALQRSGAWLRQQLRRAAATCSSAPHAGLRRTPAAAAGGWSHTYLARPWSGGVWWCRATTCCMTRASCRQSGARGWPRRAPSRPLRRRWRRELWGGPAAAAAAASAAAGHGARACVLSATAAWAGSGERLRRQTAAR